MGDVNYIYNVIEGYCDRAIEKLSVIHRLRDLKQLESKERSFTF